MLFKKYLTYSTIQSIRQIGLFIAVEFADFNTNKKIIDQCIQKGVIADWFLFAPQCMRIAPPLIITEKEIKKTCDIILSCL